MPYDTRLSILETGLSRISCATRGAFSSLPLAQVPELATSQFSIYGSRVFPAQLGIRTIPLTSHVLSAGQTIDELLKGGAISPSFHSYKVMQRLNPSISDTDTIYAGQKVLVPCFEMGEWKKLLRNQNQVAISPTALPNLQQYTNSLQMHVDSPYLGNELRPALESMNVLAHNQTELPPEKQLYIAEVAEHMKEILSLSAEQGRVQPNQRRAFNAHSYELSATADALNRGESLVRRLIVSTQYSGTEIHNLVVHWTSEGNFWQNYKMFDRMAIPSSPADTCIPIVNLAQIRIWATLDGRVVSEFQAEDLTKVVTGVAKPRLVLPVTHNVPGTARAESVASSTLRGIKVKMERWVLVTLAEFVVVIFGVFGGFLFEIFPVELEKVSFAHGFAALAALLGLLGIKLISTFVASDKHKVICFLAIFGSSCAGFGWAAFQYWSTLDEWTFRYPGR